MADKKYKGQERRNPFRPSRRSVPNTWDQSIQRSSERQITHQAGELDIGDGVGGQDRGIVELKEYSSRGEQRIGGAGRRKGDFQRALKSGEEVILDIGRTPKAAFMGKLAKKAAKHIPAIGVAAGIYDLVNRNKQ
jgi:hypothetical protein